MRFDVESGGFHAGDRSGAPEPIVWVLRAGHEQAHAAQRGRLDDGPKRVECELLADRRPRAVLALIVGEAAEPDHELVAAAIVRRAVFDRVEHLEHILCPRLRGRSSR